MRLISYSEKKKGSRPRVGVMVDDKSFLPLAASLDMISVVALGKSKIRIPKGKPVKLSSVRLLAPIPRPRKNVFCVGWNYLEHFEEGAKARAPGVELPKHPTFF